MKMSITHNSYQTIKLSELPVGELFTIIGGSRAVYMKTNLYRDILGNFGFQPNSMICAVLQEQGALTYFNADLLVCRLDYTCELLIK